MTKPRTADGYSNAVTLNCERVLVTLLRGLGPWKDSIFLIGGLTPRYLVSSLPKGALAHAGTGDVDVVVELQMLTDTDAYHTLAQNLKRMGFVRVVNDSGAKVSWRWRTELEDGVTVILEFMADDPALRGGKVQTLPTPGKVSALNIPHSSMVFEHHKTIEVTAELLGEDGFTTQTVRFADLVCFTCLKALALGDRNERKDAHDLVYCIQHATGGLTAAAAQFRIARRGKHGVVVKKALSILRNHFVSDKEVDGYRKDGAVAAAKFEHGESDSPATREARILRQRDVSDLIERLLVEIG